MTKAWTCWGCQECGGWGEWCDLWGMVPCFICYPQDHVVYQIRKLTLLAYVPKRRLSEVER